MSHARSTFCKAPRAAGTSRPVGKEQQKHIPPGYPSRTTPHAFARLCANEDMQACRGVPKPDSSGWWAAWPRNATTFCTKSTVKILRCDGWTHSPSSTKKTSRPPSRPRPIIPGMRGRVGGGGTAQCVEQPRARPREGERITAFSRPKATQEVLPRLRPR